MLLTLRYHLTTYLENALLCKQSPQSWTAGSFLRLLQYGIIWSCSKTALLNVLPSSLEVNTGCFSGGQVCKTQLQGVCLEFRRNRCCMFLQIASKTEVNLSDH